ncbi:cisplatin damage response ATP-dependent DNA ligase [Pontixanthobacter gangjinensis]|uniref:DNA ligase (ATP) n=1 Tax=Pontixanthobacter gangjinensis TaxID=1028742 RepID=A0A6I4SPX7_9SPHN|nr:cisplatin damage response ATP-dependent DNA ligase [Pontixanthobacter gangjinensis]MXO57893.1 cisplatin damage response ATP-dependent DNA ligase [Pontixanthobacter gangjinensis]
MQKFAALIDALVYTRSRNEKLRLIAEYLRVTPDPDRGWALAALTDGLDFKAVKSTAIRNIMKDRVDPELWALSRDFVGDTAECASLLWPDPIEGTGPPPSVAEAVAFLEGLTRATVLTELPKLMDRLDSSGRYALLKLATGAMRIGISARLGKVAFAQAFGVIIDEVEEYWHALAPPYEQLFAWAADGEDPPEIGNLPLFRPFMLAHPLEDTVVDLADYAAEWKWDGIRVQIVHAGGDTRVYSRSGDDISASLPEMVGALEIPAVLDGELLVRGSTQGGNAGGAASFNALQQRLGRKTVSKKMLTESPAFARLYDILSLAGEDLRALAWQDRRQHLERFISRLPSSHFDISQVVEATDFKHLAKIREGTRDDAIEGLMLKRRDSTYVSGSKTGLWYKWKRDPLLIDCVLMYAQRGSGKRSSFFSDYTFGCWDGDPDEGAELLPVGKAYSGFTDDQLKKIDRHVRQNKINRFGPVRETQKVLVFEVAFDSVHESKRHKSKLAMRFPRIHRVRWDKPAHEADRIESLRALVAD